MLRTKEVTNSAQETYIIEEMRKRGYRLSRKYQKGKKFLLVFEEKNKSS